MTNLDNLNVLQILDLEREATKAGDAAALRDCRELYDSYVGSEDASLSEHIDNERGEVRACAERIVRVINGAEAQH